jgi:hypothetical protein
MATERVRETYQKYLPPYIDTAKNVMTFSHVRYHFLTETLLKSMHERLSGAVARKDYQGILDTIAALEPYRINMRVSDNQKQTVTTPV